MPKKQKKEGVPSSSKDDDEFAKLGTTKGSRMPSEGPNAPIFRYIPMSRRKNGQSPFETETRKADTQWHTDNVKLLKTNAVSPLTQLGGAKVAGLPQGFIKALPKKVESSFLPTKRTEEGFDPNAYKLMSKAGYDFASSEAAGKKVSNTVNDKERNLTKTQKKLKEHGYGVDNNKAGLGFTPNAPVMISNKAKNTSAQYVNVSIEQDQEEPKPAPRTSVFDRMSHSSSRISVLNRIGNQDRTSVFKRLNAPTSQSSVFERLLKPKKQSNTAISPLRRSASERFEDNEKPFGKRKTTPKEEKFDGLAEKGDVRSLIPSRMKRQAILEVDTKGPLKVRRRIIVHTGKSSCQQTQKDDTEDEIPKKDVTSGSFDSKSSPRLLGACSKSSEIEGWTHVTPKKLHEKHMSSPQVHQSERGQSSYRQPSKLHENVEDDEITTQRSFMRDLFFLEDLFNFSIKAPCYEDYEECLSRIASKKLDKQQPSCPQVYQSKRGQNSSCQPPEQCESVGDNEISTQRSSIPITMCDLFPEDFFNYSVKAPSYEDCEERLSQTA